MNRHGKSLASLFAAALLLSGVAAGCARNSGPNVVITPAASSAAATATMANQSAGTELTESPSLAADTVPVSPGPASAGTTTPSAAAANPTADPLDGELQSVNQLLNGIDTSISGASAGGE